MATTRIFDTLIGLNPNAKVKSYYSDRIYDAKDFEENTQMAVMENGRYVFTLNGVAFGVLPDDVKVLDGKDPGEIAAEDLRLFDEVRKLSTLELCQKWEQINNDNSPDLRSTRTWIYDELELRNPEQFKKWLNCQYVWEIKTPSLFFN